MVILVDAMGGDNAPDAVIKGAIKASKEVKAQICLIGIESVLKQKLKEFYGTDNIKSLASNVEIYNTTEVIEMEDIPTVAIKHKKDSSMVVRI